MFNPASHLVPESFFLSLSSLYSFSVVSNEFHYTIYYWSKITPITAIYKLHANRFITFYLLRYTNENKYSLCIVDDFKALISVGLKPITMKLSCDHRRAGSAKASSCNRLLASDWARY